MNKTLKTQLEELYVLFNTTTQPISVDQCRVIATAVALIYDEHEKRIKHLESREQLTRESKNELDRTISMIQHIAEYDLINPPDKDPDEIERAGYKLLDHCSDGFSPRYRAKTIKDPNGGE